MELFKVDNAKPVVPVNFVYSTQNELFGEKSVTGFGNFSFSVNEVDRVLANEIIRENHYSKKIVNTASVHLSVSMDGQIVGILQFGVAMNPRSCGSVVSGTNIDEYLELNRMWLDDIAPRNSESKAISYAVKIIRKIRPRVKWIQSFSDERCGLFGTVYQAAGFSFHGEHIGRFWELDGEWFHDQIRTNSKHFNTPAGRRLRAGIDRAISHKLRQFRYIKFMKPRFAKNCLYPSLPYPKPDYAACPEDEC
ncbi:MAG: hypothetical protein ABJO86_00590 [Lentilitoribacter sp.]